MQRGYVSSLEGLAWSYSKMNRVDESNQVLQTALRSVEKNNFSTLDGHYIVFKQGINDYFLKNYDDAIHKIEQKIPFLNENEDFAWATVGNFYIGQSYWDMKEK
jgi:tetratricopeptide (TPR) repeat protein